MCGWDAGLGLWGLLFSRKKTSKDIRNGGKKTGGDFARYINIYLLPSLSYSVPYVFICSCGFPIEYDDFLLSFLIAWGFAGQK